MCETKMCFDQFIGEKKVYGGFFFRLVESKLGGIRKNVPRK